MLRRRATGSGCWRTKTTSPPRSSNRISRRRSRLATCRHRQKPFASACRGHRSRSCAFGLLASRRSPAYAPWNSSRRAGLYACVSTSESIPCSSLICFRRALHQRHLRCCGGMAIRANRSMAITGWSDSHPCRTMRLPNSRPRELPPAIYRQARLSALGMSVAISVARNCRTTCGALGQPMHPPIGRIP